jgi:cytochrome c551/c552
VKIMKLNAAAVVAGVLAFTMTTSLHYACAASFADAARVIESRCLSCHDSDTREAGIDLTPLLRKVNSSYGEYTGLWIKIEKMIASGEMPPADEGALGVQEREAIKQWFRESFVLRHGKPYIGPTPLRRLTRYELENTLEDVLSIKLRVPYRDTISGRIEKSTITSLVPSDIPGESGFDNDAHRMESLKPPLKEISEAVHYALGVFSNDPAARQAVLGQAELPKNATEAAVKQFVSALLLRACRCDRRQVPELADAYYGLYQKHLQVSQDSRKSLLHVFEMILVSPEFLYRLEESRNLDVPYPVSGMELATRLSYFLWSTAPDDELLQLGQDGRLLKDDVLKSQVARMLDSPKRLSLSENFAGQWLGFDNLLSNSEYFMDERWNRETYDEVLFFFDELIKSDRSLQEMVQSAWIYRRASALNARRHGYVRIEPESVKNVYADVLSGRQSKSEDKRLKYDPPVLVKAKNDREGGIITSAGIMRLTASKSRTSPIRRGVWILNTVIGKTLEPPPNVPSLEEAREALNLKENPSVAEVIQQHVSRPECVFCHKAIDPLGLGLENFAPTGAWRTHYPDKAPVVSAGIMPDGETFKTPQEMKLLLLDMYKDEIANNFVKQLLAYALGRKTEPFDRVSLDSIVSKVKEDGYKVNTAIEQIVLSQEFRFRQDR